jgi:hypothetical protein
MPVAASTIEAGAGTVVLAAAVAGGAFVYDMGAVSVSVKSKKPGGDNVRLILPGAVVPVGVWLAPKDELRKAMKDAGPYLPAISAAAAELSECPDATFIDVVSLREKVQIAKRGSHIVIDVDDPNETVHVSVPSDTVRLVTSLLASIPPKSAASGNEEDVI